MGAIQAAWEGCHVSERKDVAWVAALYISTVDESQQPATVLPTIERNELIQAQRDDPVISQVRQWKEDGVTLTDEMRAGLTGISRKIMYEWNKLHLEGVYSYTAKQVRENSLSYRASTISWHSSISMTRWGTWGQREYSTWRGIDSIGCT